ncbi:MAG: type II toxin-antitoxin system RelE/ParE family toxin [Gammaproteobacteria bacterium]|jgi:hypothetical protein|nr:type II toxin-antitoxin system RelE/ParE family toxin [Gammaproteobacteria bacterium]MBT4605819.1 type II toxin-antitoxin system RelE/ParE family toxin [Thiotrichales bacterium]MBT3968627.1 type II toxin-antitoxin system RelE/ParE family toxin [Gammaproteobacteria bacterium]MBT4079175.1 type II toxin-antitoxin system RelE/ParE family toxin [Gammaproteobacteria bacterium]MBT4810754.1 type II toxin-antitoxin system RelE/ParE family toxin [Thiotrichales bacterium]
MNVTYYAPFKRFVKKAIKPLKAEIEDSVNLICDDIEIGDLKRGDLASVRVYKFNFNRQEYLIAYRESATEVEILSVDFFKVGTHENFYVELKKYMKEKNL